MTIQDIFDLILKIGAPLERIVSFTIPIWLPWYLSRRDKAKKQKVYHDTEKIVSVSVKIEERLKNIRDVIKSDRTALWIFTNGGYYYTGLPDQKVSCYKEVNAEGMQPLAQDFQQVPCNIVGRLVSSLLDKEYYIDVDETRFEDSLAQFNKIYGVQGTAMFKIYNKQKKWSAILSVCFKSNNHVLEEKEIIYLQNQAREIGNIINYIE